MDYPAQTPLVIGVFLFKYFFIWVYTNQKEVSKMNERQKNIQEFIGYVKEDLMEFYNVTNEEATTLITDFELHELFNKHGSIVAHYSPEEYAHMIYERSNNLNKQ